MCWFYPSDSFESFLFLSKTKRIQAFKTGDAEMVKMVLNHKSAEEDILLQESSLSKDKKKKKEKKTGVSSKPINNENNSGGGGGGDDDTHGDGPSITHELGFGVVLPPPSSGSYSAFSSSGGDGNNNNNNNKSDNPKADKHDEDQDDDDDELKRRENGVRFLLRELPIRNPDECFGDDAREDTTGLNLWAAAVVLARWVASPAIVSRLEGKTVLELGAGCGAG